MAPPPGPPPLDPLTYASAGHGPPFDPVKPVVLHVVEALEAGVARHVVDVVRNTNGATHEVALPSKRVGWETDERAAAALVDAGARLHVVEMRRSPPRPENIRALLQLARLVRRLRPSVVHGHSSIGGALGRLASWGTPARRVYTPNGVNTSKPIVAVERRLGRLTDVLIAVSESEAAVVSRLGLVAPDRLQVVVNGIDVALPPPAPDLRAQLGLSPDVPLVGSIGRLVPQKAPEEFVRACATVAVERPDTHFVHVGTGPLAGALDAAIAAHSLEHRFHALGPVAGAACLVGQLDVFVLTSRFEGCPYSALEAMRAGIPVVLTDVAGNRDVIEHGASGLLAPDAAGVARAVTGLLADAAARRKIGEAGRERLRQRFDVRQMGEALSDLYTRLAAT